MAVQYDDLPPAGDGRIFKMRPVDRILVTKPVELVEEIEGLTGVRLKGGEDAILFIRRWMEFKKNSDPNSGRSFADYMAARAGNTIIMQVPPAIFAVFFAWQTDTDTKLNRWFIETAIKMAIKKIRKEFRQDRGNELKFEPAQPVDSGEPNEANPDSDPEDAEIVYQWGAQGHVGASMIAETILQRVGTCGVFIADLTLTGAVQTNDGRTKRVPNANVLIEVGAASQTGRAWERMILVMNTEHGKVDGLPFDLKHRQCQVQYALARWDDSERPKKAKRLADEIVKQLKPMYQNAITQAIEGRKANAKAASSIKR